MNPVSVKLTVMTGDIDKEYKMDGRKSSFFCLYDQSSSPALYLVTIHTFDYGIHLSYVSVTHFKTTGFPQGMRHYWLFPSRRHGHDCVLDR